MSFFRKFTSLKSSIGSPQKSHIRHAKSSFGFQKGLNRASDQEFQQLKASYLTEFDFKGIRMTATPLYSNVLRGVQTQLPVLFEIKVGQRSTSDEKEKDAVRTPFNICLVLDISGSMAGARLHGCKMAINTIIKMLGPDDVLSLVTYSSTVKTVFVDCNHLHKKHMLDAVEKIQTEGCTNLHAGLKLGVESLKRSIEKDEAVLASSSSSTIDVEKSPMKKAHRVFLFSDGLVNEGVTDKNTIITHVRSWLEGTKISVSTFGIGDGYDENLMTAIAECADGDDFFIETESDIEDLVTKSLRGVTNTVATDATFKVAGMGDAVVKDIPDYETKIPGQITIPYLRVNGLIQFIVNVDIRVPAQKDNFAPDDMEDVEHPHPVLNYALTFEGEHNVNLDDCQGLTGVVSVQYTTDSTKVAEDKRHPDVVTYLTIKEAAKIEEEVVQHLANNRTAEALKGKKRVNAMYSAVEAHDRRGFSNVMKKQNERLIQVLESQGNSSYAQKMSAQQMRQCAARDMGYDIYE
ncbi:hypothetical protein BGW41_000916 [Actinomortierella wolfii]|nr:hypothetical protein BGW41_000916 [Actinomortierella wolfii]